MKSTRSQLRIALNLSTSAQDNHLRALVLALVAAQYVHTSTEHAETMLSTAEQLAAGLGAQPKTLAKVDTSKRTTIAVLIIHEFPQIALKLSYIHKGNCPRLWAVAQCLISTKSNSMCMVVMLHCRVVTHPACTAAQ